MVEQVENPANKALHYGNVNVGILTPPNKLPQVELYSSKKANQEYNQMQYDLFVKQKQAKPPQYRKKFPTILKIIGGVAIISCAIIFKKSIIKFIKNIFSKRKTTL